MCLVVIATVGAAGAYLITRQGAGSGLSLLRAQTGPDARLVDTAGRQVLLRGANVTSFGAYWSGSRFPPVLPFTTTDVATIQNMGWDVVRLVLSWSRVEPRPGHYDDSYLDAVADAVRQLAAAHVYTILDMHQDAWSATLAARPGEMCPPPSRPNLGWDGAPAWATLGSALTHCYIGTREISAAVEGSWHSFFADAPGPGGIGIQTRFTSMWKHVATRFASTTAVAAFEIINEPLILGTPDDASLTRLYERTFTSIRAGERVHEGLRHIVMFEPSPDFYQLGANPPGFANDGDVAYAPHIYTGTFPTSSPPDPNWLVAADAQAHKLGSIPVINGEWGGRPRANGPIDLAFYTASQALQDQYRLSGQFWLYKSSCGDPHEILIGATHAGGLYDIDCRDNRVLGVRPQLVQALSRPYPRAVNGVIDRFNFEPSRRQFTLVYRAGHRRGLSEVELPKTQFSQGYHGVVKGATVRFNKGSSILSVHDCRSAPSVTVAIDSGPGPVTQTCSAS